MDGMEMLESLKVNEQFKDIPVTMVTVELERDEIYKAIEKGAKNYLIKPFSQENLIGKIMESLNMGL
jgi:CheY-like chemotaxis protein